MTSKEWLLKDAYDRGYAAGVEASKRVSPNEVVRRILDDLCDRRGLSSEWDQIDEDVQLEIYRTWLKIARGE